MRNSKMHGARLAALGLVVATLVGTTGWAQDYHFVDGITGDTSLTLIAKDGYISGPEGNSIYFWGLADGDVTRNPNGTPQYPSPTIILNQGDTLTIDLVNELPAKYNMPVSLVFPGQTGVLTSGGVSGDITREAAPNGGTVSYTFTANKPGTFIYNSGTQAALQNEMGLLGAIIVRPTGFDPTVAGARTAYNDSTPDGQDVPDSGFDHEFLFLLTDMDASIHDVVERNEMDKVDLSKWFSVYWFINGRCAPDTMSPPFAVYLPTQPYDCMPVFHPGERVLLRTIGAGRDSHPLHHHGNNSLVVAQDGNLLSTDGVRADLAYSVFTIPAHPGQTTDAIFSWTGEKLGWDAYGHAPGDPLAPHEYEPDHGKPFPVRLPAAQHTTFGMMYGGSPFLGTQGILPPGEGGFNPGGFMYMWHSHNEKEICNNNIFPGGMLTLALIEAWPANAPQP